MLCKQILSLILMEAEFGTAASVVALLGTAFKLIHQIRAARDRVIGTTKVLDDISKQLESLERSLTLVREERRLQTAGVTQQLRVITEVAAELKTFLGRLAVGQQKNAVPRFLHSLKSGDREDKELQSILDRLDRARDGLVLWISMAQVGLVGNLEDGFRVAYDVLLETNNKVNQVLGINLSLADRPRDMLQQQTGTQT